MLRSVRFLAGFTYLVASLTTAACNAPDSRKRVIPSYDAFTSQLIQLAADQNGDGRLDQWTYLDGGKPLRGEADSDGDGRIDRWEYFDANSALVRVGSSSRNDGIEDTWTAVVAGGETRIDHARHHDRQIDLREYFKAGVLVRAEEDTNADGRIDKWDRYENGVLREVAFDTTLQRERPDRRLRYDARGRFEGIEADSDGDGTFEPIAPGEQMSSGGKQ
jgi:hypothetical protein